MPEHPTYIDLFAGCGGLSLGLHFSGWKGLFAIEKSEHAFQSLKHNLIDNFNHFSWPEWLPQTNLDINQVLLDHADKLRALNKKVDLVVGGPPCQGFSTAGLRRENDVRNGLIRSYLRFIMYVRPKVILFENVKGFTLAFRKNKSKARAYSEYVLRTLRFLGYDVAGEMVDFSQYGLPQKRTRFILVGIRKDIAKNNNRQAKDFFNLIEKNKKPFLLRKGLPLNPTLRSAISDLLQNNGVVPCRDRTDFQSGVYSSPQSKYQRFLRKGFSQPLPDSHSFPNHTPHVKKRFKYILKHQTPSKNLSKAIRRRLKLRKHTIILLDGKSKAPTITTLPDDFIHYCEPRILTVRECARIQGFPDWFEFKGKYTTGGKMRTLEVPRYTQVGNAIPPLFGEQSGIAIKRMLTRVGKH